MRTVQHLLSECFGKTLRDHATAKVRRLQKNFPRNGSSGISIRSSEVAGRAGFEMNVVRVKDVPDFRSMQNYWKHIENELDWLDAGAVDHLYKLVGIGLVDNGLDECGFSSFEFQTGWDRDHGKAILMHKTNVLAAGGMQEDVNRGPDLLNALKSVQSYDLDDGDLVLSDL